MLVSSGVYGDPFTVMVDEGPVAVGNPSIMSAISLAVVVIVTLPPQFHAKGRKPQLPAFCFALLVAEAAARLAGVLNAS